MVDTTAQHIAARDDKALTARLIAVAEQAQIPNPDGFVAANVGRLVSTEISASTTLTTVHAYAAGQYQNAVAALPPLPGLDPGAVTDAQLAAAVQAVWEPAV
jgi:hypothetical protein